MEKRFKNRNNAGKVLADRLTKYERGRAIVYGLPRGGVIIAEEIAKTLSLPLDIIVTRKISHPDNPEYAVAAINENGEIVFNPREPSHEKEVWFGLAKERETNECIRRREIYTNGRTRISARGKTAIIADDGAATGLTLLAAIKDIREDVPWKIVVVLPVMPGELYSVFKHEADEVEALVVDADFLGSVGAYYDDFGEVDDYDVIKILQNLG